MTYQPTSIVVAILAHAMRSQSHHQHANHDEHAGGSVVAGVTSGVVIAKVRLFRDKCCLALLIRVVLKIYMVQNVILGLSCLSSPFYPFCHLLLPKKTKLWTRTVPR